MDSTKEVHLIARRDIKMDGMEIRHGLPPILDYHKINQKTTNLIQHKDTNGDRVLNVDELGVSEKIFAKIDRKEDGQADRRELNAFFARVYINHRKPLKALSPEVSFTA
ncbi:hypothetical protein ACFL5Z_03145 [Planctomycetota bacterium]